MSNQNEPKQDIIETISPINGEKVLTRTGITEADFPELIATSTAAFSKFRSTTLAERQEIVRKALDLLESRKEALGKELTEHMGRPIRYTAGEVATAAKRGRYLLGISTDVLADTPGDTEPGFRRWIRKEPVGPILVIFAWNVGLLFQH